MKHYLILLLATAFAALNAQAADPIRVFIRAGEKTHAPGAHEHPQFLKDWTELLESRGVECDGALGFPTSAQLAKTDVLILNAKEAGNIEGEERDNLNAFLKRGGGLVVIHAGAVSRDPDWYKGIIGGSWRHGTTKFLEAPMSLYFTNIPNPITKDISNFDLEDEIYYDMDVSSKVKVLATAYTPKRSTPKDEATRKPKNGRRKQLPLGRQSTFTTSSLRFGPTKTNWPEASPIAPSSISLATGTRISLTRALKR